MLVYSKSEVVLNIREYNPQRNVRYHNGEIIILDDNSSFRLPNPAYANNVRYSFWVGYKRTNGARTRSKLWSGLVGKYTVVTWRGPCK